MKKLCCIAACIYFFIPLINAQQNTLASGGDAKSSSGSVSYSIGQMDYISAEAAGNTNEGNQQPYEIFVYTGTNEEIQLEIRVFPNPVTYNIKLLINQEDLKGFTYLLYAPTGQLLTKRKISSDETLILMDRFAAGNYLLQVMKDKKELKSFKIIKNP